jgi:glycylpeptide N-tetradecanoyltransferase|eukprot:TRINITY_DN2281_c0_g2_i1.p1 TRINITY_DN2281_c0_g2~~TRINITY_DN2281_c0_g2_i1.p1  ORF type:complete len:547 (+),score=85.14 TRINITY_DN2281_c0_g2_i1:101-1642(+)
MADENPKDLRDDETEGAEEKPTETADKKKKSKKNKGKNKTDGPPNDDKVETTTNGDKDEKDGEQKKGDREENAEKDETDDKATQDDKDKTDDKDKNAKDGSCALLQEQLLRRTRVCEESRRHAARPHPFWDTQPVPSMGSEYSQDSKPIDEVKGGPNEVRAEPYPLPDQFEWCTCNIDDDGEAQEIYTLLSENYVEDDDSMFRFDYSVPFLKWALKPPGFLRHWHLGVRVKSAQGNGKLVGFITGIPAHIQVCDPIVKMAEINFLCVHKKLRSKRLTPVLIKEITRRVNRENIWQAVYTGGVVLPRPVSECRYWHRSLNPKKLIDVGFSHLGPRMTMTRTIKLHKVPDQPQLPGMRMMREDDSQRVFELVSAYLKKFPLHPEFDREELAHWIVPRPGVVYSYVREDAQGVIQDVCSFYSLPSSILGNDKYDTLKAAYSYWNVATSVPLHELMGDALIFAKQQDFDVFNALDVMDNEEFLKPLKFGIGDGFLQYYLYNWSCPKIEPNRIGLVLL